MYISDKCEWTLYGSNASLDEKLNSCLYSNYYSEIINFLEQNKNYGLDKVFNYLKSHKIDSIEYVKQYIARQGYGLDTFINDEDYHVRAEVAKQEYCLDKLVNDESEWVRYTVAEQGYGLDKLINDKDTLVCNVVNKYLINHNYKSVFDWAKDNGVDINIDEWLNSDDVIKKTQVVKAGYGLDVLVHDDDYHVRCAVAKQGYGFDILVNDDSSWVRGAVAHQGYGLDKLVNDKQKFVRATVAYKGYGLDKLINDEDWEVREAVVEQGYRLDKFINDEVEDVRKAVALQGYGLNILINDKYEFVRKAVRYYLKENGYKSIEDWAKDNPDKGHGTIDTKTTDGLKDFVYKVNDSNSLKVESSYESVDDFFNDSSKESFESNESIVILAVDKKIPLIKVEKALKDKKQVYKCIVYSTN